MKKEIFTTTTPLGEAITIYKNEWHCPNSEDTLSIVSGLHGDQLNSLVAASRISHLLHRIEQGDEPGYRLTGNVQIFPVVNYGALETGNASWTYDQLDVNLAFPGIEEGDITEKICNLLLQQTADSNFGIVLQTGEKHYEDALHVKIYEPTRSLKKAAGGFQINTSREIADYPALVLQLLKQWHTMGIDAFILSAGRPQVLDEVFVAQLYEGVLNFMLRSGFLKADSYKKQDGGMVLYPTQNEITVFTEEAGLFIPQVCVGTRVTSGQTMGTVNELFSGNRLETVVAPEDGFLVTLRTQPMVHEREPVAILLSDRKSKWFWPF